MRHNSLWDAAVAQLCFEKVRYNIIEKKSHMLNPEEVKAASNGINTVNFRGVQIPEE